MGKAFYNNKNMHRGSNNNKQTRTISQDFYNPYSFVPLSPRLCFLDKDEESMLKQVQDIPFENGLSGEIKVYFEALSPFCVRSSNGQSVNLDEHYFVPGTSLKGMIRSVFEIVTLSNIRNGIANKRYSMRDLSKDSPYELKSKEHPQKSGFLVQIKGQLYVIQCESTAYPYYDKNNHEDIETYAIFKKEKDNRDLKNANTISKKYELLETPFVDYEDGGKGMWFFSGFMNNKKHEYLFEIPDIDERQLVPFNEKEYDDFIFIHEKENENESWKFWKHKLKNYNSLNDVINDDYKGIVPCFFRTQKKTDTNGCQYDCVKDLGFAFLYRQPYDKTIHDFLPEEYNNDAIDLAQSVFGYVKRNDALKGRIQFGNSFIENPSFESSQTFILGSPKPTYYPFYLEQNNPNKLLTYFSQNTHISGYKRYLQQSNAKQGNTPYSKVTTTFVPLKSGTKFCATIRFHNLRNYELGALLSAISFCGHAECYHSLGYAKPYGYGKIKVSDISMKCDDLQNVDLVEYRNCFYNYICRKCGFKTSEDYLKSLDMLFHIASDQYSPAKEIRYPNMQGKEFDTIKNNKLSLRHFSPKK